MKLIGLSGSLRKGSINTGLLRAAAELAPAGVELEVRTLHGIPLYDGDLEAGQGAPAAVTELKEAIAAADGLLLATPEYNHSMPGVLKNGLDWLSRPMQDIARVFGGKPLGLMGATPGGAGTILGQHATLATLRALKVRVFFEGSLFVSGAMKLFDEDGTLKDETTRGNLKAYLEGYVEFARSMKAG